MLSFVLVGTTSASIQLDLTNNSTVPPIYGSITKSGSDTDIVTFNLTNTGNTAIYDGVLQFNGSITNLQNVDGVGAGLGVGNGTHLTASSINVGVLTLGIGSRITIRPLSGGPHIDEVVTTPEPVSLLIWLLLGLIAITAYRRRR
jgi:hypothetical protein